MSETGEEMADDLGRPELVAEIRTRIESSGPLTFAEFMELALYHPSYGYYAGRPDSRDYVTSPAVHAGFGELLTRQLHSWWQELGAPTTFDVVEVGGGAGMLAREVLAAAAARGDFARALRYHLVERQLPDELPADVRGHCSLAEVGAGLVGCVLSNELLDAFPVHRITVEGGRLLELYVGWECGRFVEVVGEPSTGRLGETLARVGARPAEGARTEVCLRALDWLGEVAGVLGQGFVLTIDYGYEAAEYYAPERRRGTLLCYHRHAVNEAPLVRVGRQDVTAHVEFTSLMRHGEDVGLETVELTTQRAFLVGLGIRDVAARLGSGLGPARRLEVELALAELIRAGGLGDFRVLVQRKR